VLRIEDTDRQRSTPENVEQIIDALEWLELDWDEGPLSQFERRERHTERIEELLEGIEVRHATSRGRPFACGRPTPARPWSTI
jgi:hypothetical protein